ncbi:MAG: hypothetical protein FD143_2100 [Ignavibacteria bacterium]|nr:MAG: hypothetical protein FD143_2100 [Ignavibacteria bacterium]KAF0159081.1 MAG: hypothetical protein FD188_2317 [Ignavibacteria bacterium]
MVMHQDFKELLMLLNENKVEYLVVGSFALAFHGSPRNTGDIDIWINISQENAKRMTNCLTEFGVDSLGYKEKDFLDEDTVIQIGVPPVRLDILTSIIGVEFKHAFLNKETILIDCVEVNYISKNDFIKNKKASGRLKDLADIEAITEK